MVAGEINDQTNQKECYFFYKSSPSSLTDEQVNFERLRVEPRWPASTVAHFLVMEINGRAARRHRQEQGRAEDDEDSVNPAESFSIIDTIMSSKS